jgi:hypothetical protein
MTKKIIVSLLLVSVLVNMIACVKTPKGTPKCINHLIRDNRHCIYQVISYDYKGHKFYSIDYRKCRDEREVLYDEDCNERCDSDLNGDTAFCFHFGAIATNPDTIWQHK